MKLIDRLFNRPKPEFQAAPEMGNMKKQALGPSYSVSGGSRSGGAKYRGGLSSSGQARLLDHYQLRQQARDAYHDTPQAKALVDRFADSVVDVGLKLELSPNPDVLGITPEAAEEWARDVEAKFDLWARTKNCHRSGNMNFYQAQRLYAIMQQRDNDQFIRLYYSKDKKLASPLQFELYDPNQIRGMGFTNTHAQTSMSDGITRDANGVELSYKVWYQDQANNSFKFEELSRIGKDSGLPHMIHGFYAEYAGQRRGYSRLAHAIQEFENITDFSSAAIKRAINMASFTFSVENSQQDPSNPLDHLMEGGAGPGSASSVFGSGAKVAGDGSQPASKFSTTPEFHTVKDATFDKPGSMAVLNLARGDQLKEIGTGKSADQFDRFIDSFTSHLAASLSIPLELVLLKFSSNYSASRAALILFWRIARIWVNEMASDWLDPTFEAWLTLEVGSGRIKAPGFSDPKLKAAWLNCQWIGAPMPNIDPQKTAAADRMYLELGATNLDRVSRNLNGSSYKANAAKLERQYQNLPRPPWSDWTTTEIEPQPDGDD